MRQNEHCICCKKRLGRWQIKYCSTHAIIIRMQRNKWTSGLNEVQLKQWYGVRT